MSSQIPQQVLFDQNRVVQDQNMAGGDNAESKWGLGEENMEVKDSVSVRTVDCLRGRLLAERMASRNAKEEADKLGNKMVELEKLLEQEAKSRKRAEKRLKCLMKKLESLNIGTCYASDESSELSSCLVDKSEVSSMCSLSTKGPQETSDKSAKNLQINEVSSCSSMEINLQEFKCPLSFDTNSDESSQMGSNLSCNNSKMDGHSDECKDSVRDDDDNDDDGVDNSMAIVAVDVQQKVDHRIDPQVLDNTVKEVLDALKYAKEQLQSSMERQRGNMIKVG